VTTYYRRAVIDGVEIFYREAGDPGNPALLLLHGFPASSFMFRRLIDLLAGQFRVIAPDYPGFGHSDAPPPSRFSYTFDHLTDIVEHFTEHLRLARYGLYMQDFGGPVGFRLATRNPGRVAFLVIQNANAYEEGLPDSFWAPVRALWADPSTANREAIRAAGMSDSALEWNYVHGANDPARIDPDSWLLQRRNLPRSRCARLPERPAPGRDSHPRRRSLRARRPRRCHRPAHLAVHRTARAPGATDVKTAPAPIA
jgi:pimeloyl-ACP methyl ester carboxylesterase